MRTDYDSTQYVEVMAGDGYAEIAYEIGLQCTAKSFPGYFDPATGGEPPSGPEFEITTIHVSVPRVNRKDGESEYMAPLELNCGQSGVGSQRIPVIKATHHMTHLAYVTRLCRRGRTGGRP